MTTAEQWERICNYAVAVRRINPGFAEQQRKALVHLEKAQHALDCLHEELAEIRLVTPNLDVWCRGLDACPSAEVQNGDHVVTTGPLKIAA